MTVAWKSLKLCTDSLEAGKAILTSCSLHCFANYSTFTQATEWVLNCKHVRNLFIDLKKFEKKWKQLHAPSHTFWQVIQMCLLKSLSTLIKDNVKIMLQFCVCVCVRTCVCVCVCYCLLLFVCFGRRTLDLENMKLEQCGQNIFAWKIINR